LPSHEINDYTEDSNDDYRNDSVHEGQGSRINKGMIQRGLLMTLEEDTLN
jgi:hypothetical protein